MRYLREKDVDVLVAIELILGVKVGKSELNVHHSDLVEMRYEV